MGRIGLGNRSLDPHWRVEPRKALRSVGALKGAGLPLPPAWASFTLAPVVRASTAHDHVVWKDHEGSEPSTPPRSAPSPCCN